MLIISLVLMAIGLVIIFVGYAIRRKGSTSFIAGSNEMFFPKNEKKLAERIGFVIILFGAETGLFPIIYQTINGIEGTHFAILAVIHIFAIFVLMILDQMEL